MRRTTRLSLRTLRYSGTPGTRTQKTATTPRMARLSTAAAVGAVHHAAAPVHSTRVAQCRAWRGSRHLSCLVCCGLAVSTRQHAVDSLSGALKQPQRLQSLAVVFPSRCVPCHATCAGTCRRRYARLLNLALTRGTSHPASLCTQPTSPPMSTANVLAVLRAARAPGCTDVNDPEKQQYDIACRSS